MNQIRLLNIKIDNLSMSELLERLSPDCGGIVLTPNVDHLMKLQNDDQFYEIYQAAQYRVCDSQILMYASKFLGTPIGEKISGSDLFPAFCQKYGKDLNVKIFLLGGGPNVAQQARENINRRAGRELVVAAHSPSYGFETKEQECQEILELINQSGANVLAVGLGAPKQEKWIFKCKDSLKNIRVFLAVGATLNFEAGVYSRAPKWMSELGVEWLFRLSCEPRRLWRRYLVEGLPFFKLVVQQKLNCYQDPFASKNLLISQNKL
ncbi:MAG: WecB/TagA/CpsF family glycosyltransferase [Leptolyngbyaceae cyanobacterium SM1_1_3]|nr:WecB/TagA/CpsF family glycosyltransferase [Leptolyngbyaceae cyanobacterium SM1_1_3]NJM85359.1 WecB/TagA/CpsF family glycosyltransferase [Leptolyngbyaceae cyanobacterium RM2_2_21]NJN01612.1 WecB/TagA/CpsF family glycosyltransferase [Leptolyngbyaceae cyanobacterium RM1_1_2]NJO09858.1 WecB/TagA/CpsF family glycosyltransferase [Leptolyngbyaceae cyanobacterium SL_1_1]